MSKLTKNELKSIVKECLIEILAEGLVGRPSATLNERRQLKSNLKDAMPAKETQQKSKFSYLDNIHINKKRESQINERLLHVQKQASKVTDDPLMASIFADTAATTLQQQSQSSSTSGASISVSGDQAAKIVEASDPISLFGGQSEKWAALAFNNSIGKS